MTHLLRWLRALPSLVYAVLGVITVAGALYTYHEHAVSKAFAEGQNDVIDQAEKLSSEVERLRADSISARKQQHTDSVSTVVKWRIASVDSAAIVATALAQQLPPEIDTIPKVVELKTAVFALSAQTTQLVAENAAFTVKLDDERTAHAAQLALYARDLNASQKREIGLQMQVTQVTRERDARPRWRTVAKVGGAMLAIGIGAGKYLLSGSTR